jgi:hypothetical protein
LLFDGPGQGRVLYKQGLNMRPEALKSPKELLYFTEAEGAGDHCEQMARSLFHQKAFNWLDETLGTNAP